MRSEFDEAMERLKNNKTSEVDAIPTELIKNVGEILTGRLLKSQHLHAWNNYGRL